MESMGKGHAPIRRRATIDGKTRITLNSGASVPEGSPGSCHTASVPEGRVQSRAMVGEHWKFQNEVLINDLCEGNALSSMQWQVSIS